MDFREWLLVLEGAAENQARAILSSDDGKWVPRDQLETILKSLSDKAPEPKYLPIMAYFAAKEGETARSLQRDFAIYKTLVDDKKLPLIQITKKGATWGNAPVHFLQFSEKVHAQQDQVLHRGQKKRAEAEVTDATPIFSKNNIYVYEANSPQACVKLGKSYSFCISQPGGSMWQSYRDAQESTFYFVFDKNRSQDDPLHVVVVDMSTQGPQLTDANNRTGEVAEFGSDAEAYLQHLESKGIPKSVFKNKPATPEEKKEADALQYQIYHLQQFKNLSHDFKSKYIGRGHELTDSQFDYLWDNDVQDLIKQYVSTGMQILPHQRTKVISSKKYKSSYLRARFIAAQVNHPLDDSHIANDELQAFSSEQIKQLATQGNYSVKIQIANFTPDPELLVQLAQDENDVVRGGVAHNPKTSSELLVKMANDPKRAVRQHVASNSNTPQEILAKLAKDEMPAVRNHVARNKNTPSEILLDLAHDKDEMVRGHLAINEKTPPEAFSELAKSSNWVKSRLVGNRNLPEEVALQIAKNSSHDIRRELAQGRRWPSVLVFLANDENSGIRAHVAMNSKTPSGVLVQLAKDEIEGVRANMAHAEYTPPEILAQLAKDDKEGVRVQVAGNKSTPPEILAQLAKDEKYAVRIYVANNGNAPPEALARLANQPKGQSMLNLRVAVAKNPNTTPEVVAQMIQDDVDLQAKLSPDQLFSLRKLMKSSS